MSCSGNNVGILEISSHMQVYFLMETSIINNPALIRKRFDAILFYDLTTFATCSIKNEVSDDMVYCKSIMSLVLLICQMKDLMNIKIHMRCNGTSGKDRIGQLDAHPQLRTLMKHDIVNRSDARRQRHRECHVAVVRTELIIQGQFRNQGIIGNQINRNRIICEVL